MRSLNTGYFVAPIAIIFGFLPLFILVKIETINYAFALISYALLIFCIICVVLLQMRKATHYQILFKTKNAINDSLVEHIGDGLLRINEQKEISYISNSAKKLFNCQTFELAGSGFFNRIHVLDRPLYMSAISNALHQKHKQTISIRMRCESDQVGSKIAKYIWVEIAFSPVSLASGSVELVALLRDITKEKLLHDEMFSAQKAAEISNNEKSQFLAIVGHELRTPLNAIVGFSDMMVNDISGKLEPEQKEYARIISQSGHHLVGVVNSILDISKIEAGRFELDISTFNPEGLISPAIDMVRKIAREKNIQIAINKDANLPIITADERACLQIIINLLSNAIKFSNPGSFVSLSLYQRGNFLEISVKDQGIGMSEKHIAKLGQPFFQADSKMNRNYEGTGLGVSIIKGLVALHKGRFNVQSKINHGTNISVLLPIKAKDTQHEKSIFSLHSFNKKNKTTNQQQQIKRVAP